MGIQPKHPLEKRPGGKTEAGCLLYYAIEFRNLSAVCNWNKHALFIAFITDRIILLKMN